MTSCGADYFSTTIENQCYIFFIFIVIYLTPALGISFYYGRVYSHVKAHEKAMKEQVRLLKIQKHSWTVSFELPYILRYAYKIHQNVFYGTGNLPKQIINLWKSICLILSCVLAE